MPLLATLRRSALRRPLAWALGLALVLVGAQTASTLHELSHALPVSAAAPLVGAPSGESPGASADPAADRSHLASSSDCARCLAGAALAGAATAPRPALHFGQAEPGFFSEVAHTPRAPRFTRFYAPRAPPAPLRTA